jgi:succinyl-diaminopimelate desuccinylase
MSREGIFSEIEKSRAEMVALETLLSSIPAISPESGGTGEWEKALALEAWLKERGVRDIAWLPCPDPRVPGSKRPNLIATVPGSGEGRLWLMSHLDVVPPGEMSLWKTDPFTVVERDGRIYGRGVEDDQQGLTSSVFATLAFLRCGVKPQRTVKLLFVADEEMGSEYGVQHLLKERDLFRPDDLILIPDSGCSAGTEIEVAEKNLLWLKITTTGKQCHGSVPDEGNNAFLAACDLALRLHALESSVFTARDSLFIPDRTTISPTKKEANVPNVNTIPGEDVFYLDCRILPEYPVAAVLAEFDKAIKAVEAAHGVKIGYEIEQRVESKATRADAPIVQRLSAAIESVYGVKAKPIGIGGGTVGAFLRNIGLDAVVWSKLDETAHQPNESASIDNIVGDSKVMALLMGLDS